MRPLRCVDPVPPGLRPERLLAIEYHVDVHTDGEEYFATLYFCGEAETEIRCDPIFCSAKFGDERSATEEAKLAALKHARARGRKTFVMPAVAH